jgi:hypothetical protein
MNKIANEDELVKKALQIGAVYAKKRAYGEIEVQDSVKLKVEFASTFWVSGLTLKGFFTHFSVVLL